MSASLRVHAPLSTWVLGGMFGGRRWSVSGESSHLWRESLIHSCINYFFQRTAQEVIPDRIKLTRIYREGSGSHASSKSPRTHTTDRPQAWRRGLSRAMEHTFSGVLLLYLRSVVRAVCGQDSCRRLVLCAFFLFFSLPTAPLKGFCTMKAQPCFIFLPIPKIVGLAARICLTVHGHIVGHLFCIAPYQQAARAEKNNQISEAQRAQVALIMLVDVVVTLTLQ